MPRVHWCVVLKEYADVKRVSPDYYDMCSSGPQHDQTFSVKVKVDPFVAEGTGKTKKAAKDQAARSMVELITQDEDDLQSSIYTTGQENQHGGANIVGELQELCQRRGWPLPVYREDACDPSQHRCLCRVKVPMEEYEGNLSIRVKGSGSSKVGAKRRAAQNALNLIKLLKKTLAGEPQRVTEIPA